MSDELNTVVEEKPPKEPKEPKPPKEPKEPKEPKPPKEKKEKEKKLPRRSKKEPSMTPEESSKKYRYIIQNQTVRRHSRKRRFTIALAIFLAAALVVVGTVYGLLSAVRYNNLKVMVDKESADIISLSSTGNFANPTQRLTLQGPKYMDNVSILDMYVTQDDGQSIHLMDKMDSYDGTYSDASAPYIASTFYLKNITDTTRQYTEEIVLENVTKDMDTAMRVYCSRNGVRTIYAREKSDGSPEEVVPGMYYTTKGTISGEGDIWMATPFQSPQHVLYNSNLMLAPGEVVKYSVIIWLEGWDEQCVDAILGGTVRVSVNFRVN